ncbi:unnamed protein product [Brassica rapa]|uniref:PPM-type phosphatase domain-containing protein n=2 Tax=Brassica TaxID=3705 RepID=A0A3P5YFJ4_BRACM|nr:unnamed protein product [Brassica napus]CAG7860183.1 unnamed protein product [Brassica rapa]CDY19820.1 BnaA09g04730D [Brassica napus]VDC58668.1 unnamed protein product [Brassica rapa]
MYIENFQKLLGSYREDRFETRIDGIVGEIVGLFGVFDGNINNLYLMHNTDCELLKSENSHTRDPDSTASTAILVGDSRAVIYRSGNGNVIEDL